MARGGNEDLCVPSEPHEAGQCYSRVCPAQLQWMATPVFKLWVFFKKNFFNFYFLSFVNLEFQSFLFLFFKRKKHNWIDSIAVKQLGVLE